MAMMLGLVLVRVGLLVMGAAEVAVGSRPLAPKGIGRGYDTILAFDPNRAVLEPVSMSSSYFCPCEKKKK